MYAYSRSPIQFAGDTFGPGVFEADDSLFHALAQRGPIRPATGDEVREHLSARAPEIETASLPPRGETAVAPAQRKKKAA